jgi:hypothetical protein
VARTQDRRPRASNGRFVKRKKASPRAGHQASAPDSRRNDAVQTERVSPREGLVQLGILTLAIVVAVCGFALHFLWIGALVLMGVLWGTMIAESQQRRGTVKGLAAEMVTTVVDEARGAMDATSGSEPGAEHGLSSSGA